MDSLLNTCVPLQSPSYSIAYYSHLVPIVVFLVVTGFIVSRSQEVRLKGIFSLFVGTFVLWLIGDLVTWISANYYLIYAVWATLDFFEISFFVLGAYFVASLVYPEKLPLPLKLFLSLLLIVPFAVTITGQSTFGFNQAVCESVENSLFTTYRLFAEISVLTLLMFFLFRVSQSVLPRKAPLYAIIISSVLFLGTFSLASYLASLTYYYEFLFYGLLALPVFFIVLVYAITNNNLFRVQSFGVQVLIYLILILVSAQYLFVTSTTVKIIIGITLVLTAVFGYLFQQSALREIKLRDVAEKLAKDLEVINERQEGLIHFIGHEVKGFLTRDAGTFAALIDGDMGVLPPPTKPFLAEALEETRRGVDSVSSILKAANLKRGTVTYEKAKFDLKALLTDAVAKVRAIAEKKGLTLSLTTPPGACEMTGDKAQINDHVLRNLLDNAINYTPNGSVDVRLDIDTGKYVIRVKDSGVGITPEDAGRLFTEGGHGKDSQKVNAHSTGYGLYIAKQIAIAHGGTIRAESEGTGKGSTFTVELPIS